LSNRWREIHRSIANFAHFAEGLRGCLPGDLDLPDCSSICVYFEGLRHRDMIHTTSNMAAGVARTRPTGVIDEREAGKALSGVYRDSESCYNLLVILRLPLIPHCLVHRIYAMCLDFLVLLIDIEQPPSPVKVTNPYSTSGFNFDGQVMRVESGHSRLSLLWRQDLSGN